MSLFAELKRRNVVRMGIAYAAVSWLLIEVSDTVMPRLGLPDWTVTFIIVLLMLGFPLALFFSWVYQVTPDGIKRESEIDGAQSINKLAGRKLDRAIVAVLVIALAYFAFDKFVLGPERESEPVANVEQAAPEPVLAAAAVAVQPDSSIAVLPFVNLSSDEEQEYFSDGLSEELLNLLAKVPGLHVAARTSSFSFKGKDLGIPEIASRLKVAHVLEGSVRKQGNQVRITAQLIQAGNGYHLWSETYDRRLDNIFQIQEEIAIAVVDALKIALLGEAPKTRKTDPAAYQLFLEGLHLKRQLSRDSLQTAIDAFNRAVEIDPSYAPAWAELADTYIWGGGSEKLSPKERAALADQAIERAISIDPDYAFAYYVRGISWIYTKRNFDRGIEDFQHALELEPDNAFMIAAIGKHAFVTGQFDRAITQFQAALALEPVVPEFHWFLGRAYLGAERLDEAEASFRKTLELSTALSTVTSASGSPRTAIRSAYLPGSSVPTSRSAQQVGGIHGGGDDRLRRRHAVLHHQLELVGIAAVQADAGVGAEGDLHAGRHARSSDLPVMPMRQRSWPAPRRCRHPGSASSRSRYPLTVDRVGT
jgi:adenylate cyclase